MMNNTALDNELRNNIIETITRLISEEYNADVMLISSSKLCFPCIDSAGNEKYCTVQISIPRGTRTGKGGYEPFDGYKAAEEYKEDMKNKEEEKRANREKKEMEERAKAAKRALRAAKKEKGKKEEAEE